MAPSIWGQMAAGNGACASVTFRVDTNPFSPTGPYAGAPAYGIVVAAVAVAALGLWWRRRRLRAPPKSPPEQVHP